MAHRMAFPANRGVPLAIKVSEAGDGWVMPYDSDDDFGALPDPSEATAAQPNLRNARVDVFALDIAPRDKSDEKDLLYVAASFEDVSGRRVDLRSTGVALEDGHERFGGVCSNLYYMESDQWSFQPLRAWSRFEVRIDGLLVETDLAGSVVVSESMDDDKAAPALSIALYSERIDADGLRSATLEAATGIDGPGWLLHWDDVTYRQAPVLSVRAEKGDTLAKIAKEMSVDHELLSMANAERKTGRRGLLPGDLVLVPLLVRAVTPAPRRVYPSQALSWQEIMNGWTTLN